MFGTAVTSFSALRDWNLCQWNARVTGKRKTSLLSGDPRCKSRIINYPWRGGFWKGAICFCLRYGACHEFDAVPFYDCTRRAGGITATLTGEYRSWLAFGFLIRNQNMHKTVVWVRLASRSGFLNQFGGNRD